MVEAIRYGERPDVRARLTQMVDAALDRDHLKELVEERVLSHDSIDASRVHEIREEMERAEPRRLQPHFISSFLWKVSGCSGARSASASRGATKSRTFRLPSVIVIV